MKLDRNVNVNRKSAVKKVSTHTSSSFVEENKCLCTLDYFCYFNIHNK